MSMGLGCSWEFEREAVGLHPGLKVHVYDHTVSEKVYRREYWSELASFLSFQSPWRKVLRRRLRVRDYRQFFDSAARHFQECIDPQSLSTAFARTTGTVFVKMDIEGSEYDVLAETLSHADDLTGLAIEFHDTGARRDDFERLLRLAGERFAVVHMHANNFMPAAQDGLPEAIEITLARREFVRGTQRRSTLPLPGLDSPNNPQAPDYRITFG